MAYQRPFQPPPLNPFALASQMPLGGQFFNTGPPRPLLGMNALAGPAGLRMPPMRPQMMPSLPPRPRIPRPVLDSVKITLPPKTTVFVGNISEEVQPELMERILEECGRISEWKRMHGTNGKLQAFGFCVFDHPDATRRAIRMLNGFFLGGKALNIKIEEKVKNMIRDYEVTRRQEHGLPPVVIPIGELPTSKEDCDMDILSKQKVIEMIQLVDPNMLRIPQITPEPEETRKVSSSSESEFDEGRRRRSPRGRRRRSRSSSRSFKRSRSRSPNKRRRTKERSSKKPHKRRKSESEAEKSDGGDEISREEKKAAKDRETVYEKKLKRFEEKEVRFLREVERNKERIRRRDKQHGDEALKLRTFHEDYDDDRDDSNYYTGDNYIQRRREYDRFREADARDQEAEKKELEKIRQEIMAEGGLKRSNDIETEANRRFDKVEVSKVKPKASPTTPVTPVVVERQTSFKPDSMTISGWEAVASPLTNTKLSLGKKINVQKTEVKSNGLFDDDNDEEAVPKKRLKPFEISSEDRIATLTPEERKRMIRDLIDTIPKTREAIFSYPMHWELLDASLIETRIKPWIGKKVLHYIGEDEPALVTFICDCIKKKADPKKLVLDLSLVVDEEAESFITKLWRLMIYETEAKRIGLTKDSSSNQDQGNL